ncbi:MAG TPA: YbjQ family protein [Thermoanaerobaculia bacterium]
MIPHNFITSANELPGYRVVKNVGIVRGITVRSRSIVGTIGAGLQSLLGGNITLWTQLCERAREEAFELMAQHARDAGGNAVIAMRYDTTEIAQGVAEVLAYGTAVVVEVMR